jgi:hypothetical protein
MRVLKMAVIVSTLVGAAACSRDAKPVEPQQKQLTWLDSLMTQPAQPTAAASALELNQAPVPQPAAQPLAVAQVEEKPVASAPRRTTTHRSTSSARHRSSSGSSGTYASSGPVYRQPRVTTVKHTRRDAAIGAGAGAVVGAVAGGGRHRVRGAIVGGVLGGVAGAVIGNNVDKSRHPDF